jgi:hypothetical protein
MRSACDGFERQLLVPWVRQSWIRNSPDGGLPGQFLVLDYVRSR